MSNPNADSACNLCERTITQADLEEGLAFESGFGLVCDSCKELLTVEKDCRDRTR